MNPLKICNDYNLMTKDEMDIGQEEEILIQDNTLVISGGG